MKSKELRDRRDREDRERLARYETIMRERSQCMKNIIDMYKMKREGLSYNKIGKIYGLSSSAVYYRLKKCLGKYPYERLIKL